jgi:DEAD/DEAH box helicase domain-containing protein
VSRGEVPPDFDLDEVLDQMLRGTHHVSRTWEPRDPVYHEEERPLVESVEKWLKAQGVRKRYSHQARAIDVARQGRDLIVVTGTSSGKSLCYTVPALESCVSEPIARHLWLFPTKALAQDQLGRLLQLVPKDQVLAATYDGDTPKSHRSTIRQSANIILTNPDMLHVGMLPGHETWGKFFRGLRTIVLDEAHVYRGVFGGHVGWVLRRLLRLAEWYGARPQIIACSATVAEPAQLFRDLTGREAVVIEGDGSPSGGRRVVLVAPGLASEDSDEDAPRGISPNVQTGRMLANLVSQGAKTMAFCRARVATELVLRVARDTLRAKGGDPDWVDSYRGGYTPEERRAIERRLFDGRLRGLATTSAMELGVDVGGLDVVLINGYPGRISSFWQQVGRAGRSRRYGAAVMLAHEDPLELALTENPALLLHGGAEVARPAVFNLPLALAQLKCAAHERALGPEDRAAWEAVTGATLQAAVGSGLASGELVESAGRVFYPAHQSPARDVNLRSAGGSPIVLRVGREPIGTMERFRAYGMAHPGAIYLHRGETYIVNELNLATGIADLESIEATYFTRALAQSVVEPHVEIARVPVMGGQRRLVGATVTTVFPGFQRIALNGHHIVGEEELDMPAETLETIALRLEFGPEILAPDPAQAMTALHTLEHALRSSAPWVAQCDRDDLGSSWTAFAADSGGPALALYDTIPGGLGLSEALFERWNELLQFAHDRLERCRCEDGCPLCVMSSHCEAGNQLLSRTLGLDWLGRMMAPPQN